MAEPPALAGGFFKNAGSGGTTCVSGWVLEKAGNGRTTCVSGWVLQNAGSGRTTCVSGWVRQKRWKWQNHLRKRVGSCIHEIMRTWEDNQIPLAYLITFRTYGTWLHGDERTSIDRFMNKFGTPRIPTRPARESYNKSIMKGEPVRLNAKQRNDVDKAIREVCEYRNWDLKAINVRTNHVHIVVSTGDRKPEKALNAFKAYATRRMKEKGNWTADRSPWVDKGSLRWLWYEQSVFYACDYVNNWQGADLTEFDSWADRKNSHADAEGSACDVTEEPTR